MNRASRPAQQRRAALALAIGLGVATPAAAAPDDVVARALVLPADSIETSAVVEIDLSIRRLGEPTSMAPDIAVGVTPDLTVGVVHSARGLGQIDAGRGLCFRNEEHGCARAYDNVALDARWSLARGRLAAAARGRLIARSFDPWKPRVGAGALVRWARNRFAISSDPSLSLGLAARDRGNRAALDVPVWLAVQPTCRWALHLRTGVHGTLATYGDTYEVPFGLGVTASPHRSVDLAAEAAFRRLLGPQNDFKTRAMWLAVTVRWP